MLERDYIMRLVRQFFEALAELKEKKEYGDVPDSGLDTGSMYRAYFLRPESFFYEQDGEFLLHYLQTGFPGGEFLQRVEMLAELFCFDADTKASETERLALWKKALFLLVYLDTHSDTFSFARREKIRGIRKLLNQ